MMEKPIRDELIKMIDKMVIDLMNDIVKGEAYDKEDLRNLIEYAKLTKGEG